MSGESKEAISWYFMISHLVISCRLLWLPMTSQDFDRYPQIWVPSLQTITCWHQENESWLVKIPDHTAFSAAGAGGTSWLEATTKCNIKCWGIKEAGNTGHCQCREMSKESIHAISWYIMVFHLVDAQISPERIRIPYDSLTPDHHRLKPRKCNMTGEDPRSHGLLSSWSLWYFLVAGHKKYATYCNIKCLGIKEAGITGHCQCGEMSKQAISWYFVLSYLVDSYEFPRFPKIFPDLYNKTNSHEFPHCRPSQADTKEMYHDWWRSGSHGLVGSWSLWCFLAGHKIMYIYVCNIM